jgi:hypothetical protein
MNKRKNSDGSVIFQHRKWPKTGKNPDPDSALVSSSERGRGDANKRRGIWLPFLDVFRTVWTQNSFRQTVPSTHG